MTVTLLYIFIGILVVLFIIGGIVIAIGSTRSRNAGTGVKTVTDPIPDASQRNQATRIDKDVTEQERHSA